MAPTSGSSAPIHIKVGTCLAEGGSILAVDMSGTTGDEVQLVGSLVAQPFTAGTGADAYLFRGEATQLAGAAEPDGRLPWGLPQGFVAEVQVEQTANTGSLTVVFLQTESQSGAHPGAQSTSAPGASGSETSSAGGATGSPTSTTEGTTTSGSALVEDGSPRSISPMLVGGGASKRI